MINNLFNICVHFLEWLGKVTGLTYKEISVVFNLWIQGSLLLLSASFPIYLAIGKLMNTSKAITDGYVIAAIIMFILCLALFSWMIVHYWGNINHAFDLCVTDLLNLANKLGTSYNMINIMIFIIGWLLVVGANIFIYLNIKG